MEKRRCVAVVLYDAEHRLLLQERKGISRSGEEWSFFGGHLEGNETPEQAAVRELREELGYELRHFQKLEAIQIHENGVDIEITALLSPLDPQQALTLKEGSDMRLFSFEEADRLKMFEGDKQILVAASYAFTKVHNVAHIVFYDMRKRILLQKRNGYRKYCEEWAYFGGHVDPGETPEEAVVRETKEELGFDLRDHTYLGHLSTNLQGLAVEHNIFIAPYPGRGELRVLEGAGMRLFSIRQAFRLRMFPGDDEVLKVLERVI